MSGRDARGRPPISQRTPIGVAVAGLVVAVAASSPSGWRGWPGCAVAAGGLGWAALRLRRASRRLPIVLPLDRAARAVVDAYRELGELSDAAAASLEIEPRASGYLRCVLTEATPEESARFADALDELAGVSDAPRYLVARPLPEPGAGALHAARPRARAAAAVPGPPPPGAGRPRAPQGARRGVRARLAPAPRPVPGWSSRSGPRRAAARAPRRPPRTAATRRSCATSGSEPACPAPRPRGPAPRGRPRSSRPSAPSARRA